MLQENTHTDKEMSFEWSQTIIFLLTPFFFMLLMVETDDDDNGPPDGGVMTPVYQGAGA